MDVIKKMGKTLSKELYITVLLDSTIVEITENCKKVLGYTRSQMLNEKLIKFLSNKSDIDIFDSQRNKQDIIKLKHKNGNNIYMDVNWKAVKEDGDEYILLRFIDITKYKDKAEENLQIINILKKSRDIVYSFNTKPKVEFNYLSPAVYDNLGYTVEEHKINPMIPFQIVHPDDKQKQMEIITGSFDYSKAITTRLKHKKGHYIWFENFITPTFNDDGELIRLEGITRNIHKRKELEDKLMYLSYHDILTGHFNRRYFEKCKERLNKDQDKAVALIICDLDNLKITNDTLGHESGDTLIRVASKLIEDCIGEDNLFARIGGDEFVVVLEDIEYEEVEIIAGNIRKSIQDYNINNFEFPVQISIGFEYSSMSIDCMEEIFRNADKDMYRNKQNRKAQ